jgi:hypothetical protein
MANLQVKNVPEEIYAELRRRAELEHITIRDYVLRLIKRDQERMHPIEWLERLHTREPVYTGQSAADGIAEDRAEREAHLDRVHEEYLERMRALEESSVERSA